MVYMFQAFVVKIKNHENAKQLQSLVQDKLK